MSLCERFGFTSHLALAHGVQASKPRISHSRYLYLIDKNNIIRHDFSLCITSTFNFLIRRLSRPLC
jgi:hypothetical protein